MWEWIPRVLDTYPPSAESPSLPSWHSPLNQANHSPPLKTATQTLWGSSLFNSCTTSLLEEHGPAPLDLGDAWKQLATIPELPVFEEEQQAVQDML